MPSSNHSGEVWHVPLAAAVERTRKKQKHVTIYSGV